MYEIVKKSDNQSDMIIQDRIILRRIAAFYSEIWKL